MDTVDLAESQGRASATLAKVKAGIESGQAPLITQIVQVIRDLSGKADEMSVAELAETISRDSTTMTRIISIAGSLGYNPNGTEVTSIQQAIGLIGFERIRILAVSLLLIGNSDQKNSIETNREIGGLALSSGLFAAEMCRRGVPVDPDLAFLCSALRSYGRMLMATFMAEDYSRAVEMAKHGTSDMAFEATFGMSPLALGRELLASMNLPPIILNSLKLLQPKVAKQAAASPSANLISVAEFGLRVAEAISSPELSADNFNSRMESISEDYGDQFKLTKASVKALVQNVSGELDSFTARAGGSRDPVVIFQRLDALATGQPLPPAYVFKAPSPDLANAAPDSDAQRPAPANRNAMAERLLGAATNELTRLIDSENPDIRQIFNLLLGTLQKALQLSSCIIFIKEKGGTRFHVGYGIGTLLPVIRAVVLDPAEKNIFALPLKRGEDVLIQNPDDEKMRSFVPEWLRQPGQVLPFFLLPIKDERCSFALVCATSTSSESFSLVSRFSAELRRIRTQLSRIGPLLTETGSAATQTKI